MLHLQTFLQRASDIRNCSALALLVGLLGFGLFVCLQEEASKSSGDSMFLLFFLLTQQITLTNHTRTSSALTEKMLNKGYSCTQLSQYNSQMACLHLKTSAYVRARIRAPLQDALPEWNKGI